MMMILPPPSSRNPTTHEEQHTQFSWLAVEGNKKQQVATICDDHYNEEIVDRVDTTIKLPVSREYMVYLSRVLAEGTLRTRWFNNKVCNLSLSLSLSLPQDNFTHKIVQ